MAKNREPEKPVESESESTEEEEGEGASSEEEDGASSDGEPEQTQVGKKPSPSRPAAVTKSQPPTSSKPQQTNSSDDEESGSESESDSDGPDQNVKPLASKPMDDPEKSSSVVKRTRSKPNASEVVTPTKSPAGKRPAEEKETDTKDGKRSKKKPEPENSEKKSNDDSKKSLFQRLWSEDDEIVILKGMIDYASKKKSDPLADLNAFHDFIKKNLHVEVTRTQLQDKIRRLRKKYENNKNKEKDGKDRTFSKPHEQKAYELSKKIWGNENGKENGGEKAVGSPKANGVVLTRTPSKRANVTDNEEAKDVKTTEVVNSDEETPLPATVPSSYTLRVEDSILRIGAELFEGGKGLEGERQWKKLKLDEIEAYWRQMEVRTAQAKLVFDTLKSAFH